MDSQELLEKYKPIIKENFIPISLALLGLIFFVYGLISLFGSSKNSNTLTFEQSRENTASESAVKNILVDIEGAVIRPGVYKLSSEARVSDALVAALGLSAEADRSWTEKNLNLASKLIDGAKIYIPRNGDDTKSINSSKGIAGVKTNDSGVIIDQSGLININTATEQELDTLYGIGLITAQKIINNRPYGSVNELVSKKVITQKVLDKIKDKITAD